ncbi:MULTISPECIES: hypothetical protein [Bradyrhizobium]|uniref:Oligosaccharide repeat unit polymerase n=1 Tax=Bradyrhizobium ottawaense TaxID=931866 RepID=A0ABV4FXU2_9BRAD|nr:MULTISPECIES: hypothetical protein [Bradyrhizobium]PDT67636.1 hypothetical protein CO683_20605 [Bradyrhizobium ottawaense]
MVSVNQVPTSARASIADTNGTPSIVALTDVILFTFLTAYLGWSLVYAANEAPSSIAIQIVLSFNGILGLVGLRRSLLRGYPLFVVFFLFSFLFHSLAPLQQIAERKSPIFHETDVLLLASALCIPFTLFGLFLVFRRRPKSSTAHRQAGLLNSSLLRFQGRDTTLLLVVTGATTTALLLYYLPVLFTNRQAASSALSSDASKTALIFLHAFVDPFAFVGAFVGLLVSIRSSDHGRAFLFGAITLLAAVVNNPLIHARYQSSALIVFALLAIYGWNRTRLILYTIIAGISVSPIFNSLFRYNSVSNDTRRLENFFAHMDYDALNIFCYTIIWVRERGIEYGNNLFGALLFFIPRSLWNEKGQHPAQIIFGYLKEYEGYTIDNLSSPPPVEGYLAFGVMGALALPLVVAMTFDAIERRAALAQPFSPWQLIVCMLVMMAMIFLRGPLQVGFAEAVMRCLTILATTYLLYAGAVMKPRHRAHVRKARRTQF